MRSNKKLLYGAVRDDDIANEGEKRERKEAKKESLEKFLTVEWLRTSIKYSTQKNTPIDFQERYRKKIMLFFYVHLLVSPLLSHSLIQRVFSFFYPL